jgi:hypothetical protein
MSINRSECRKYLLGMSEKLRGGKFTRVGADVFDHLDDVLRREMREFVRSHPSLGKTLSTGIKKQKEEGWDAR